METKQDNTPSSNSISSVKSKTDRSYDHTNDLRGDRKFAEEFAASETFDVTEFNEEPFKNPYEREYPNSQNTNKPGVILGSREDSLETED